jgi:hypothetical protein
MVCVGDAAIGPLRQRFWAVCEPGRPVVARTTLLRRGVRMDGPRALVDAGGVRIDLTVEEDGGVETRCRLVGARTRSTAWVRWTRRSAATAATRRGGGRPEPVARSVGSGSAGTS